MRANVRRSQTHRQQPAKITAKTFADLPLLLTIPEAATLARVSARTVWRWIAKDRITVRRLPGAARLRIKRDDLLGLLGVAAT